MKKKMIIALILVLIYSLMCQAQYPYQDLSVIQEGQNYLLVENKKSTKVKIDSTELQVLTVTTIEDKKIVIDTIKGNYADLKSIETMIIRNYDQLKNYKRVDIDSIRNSYNLMTIWKKERIKKSFTISLQEKVINVRLNWQQKNTWPNLEYPLLLILTISLLYFKLNAKKSEKQINLIMTVGLMIITAIACPSNSVEGNLLSILLMPLIFNILMLGAFKYAGLPIDLAITATMSIFAGYLSLSFDFIWLTAVLSALAIFLICWQRDKQRKIKVLVK